MTDALACEATELSRRFGSRVALDRVSFTLRRGELVGLVGNNGAGKTTLLSILAGVQPPDTGSVTVAGPHAGWVPQSLALYHGLSVAENLRLFARLEGVEDVPGAVAAALDATGLAERAGDPVARLSGGSRQRVNIAVGLITAPALLLLDEPSAGLDPEQRERLWELLRGLAARGTTVLFSTHDLGEIDRHADRVLTLRDGRLHDPAAEHQHRSQPPPDTPRPRPLPRARQLSWLLVKDLQIVRRSPLLCALLVAYPIVLALIVGAAFSSPPAKPTVAYVNEVSPHTGAITVGHQRLDIADYARGLLRSVHAIHARSPAAAIADVRSGRALAAVVVPADLPQQIESLITQGVGSPTVHVYLNTRNPLERSGVEQVLQARIAGVQSDVSRRVLQVAAGDLQRVLGGGTVTLLGQSVHLLGLRDSRAIVDGTIASLPRRSSLRIALRQVSAFASVAIAGLGFAKPVLGSIGSPLTVTQTQIDGATTPTSVYAAAIAVVVVLMVVAMLLAAGVLALEYGEGTYARLVRGLVTPGRLLGEKALLAGGCAAVLAFVMAAGVSAFVALQWSRVGLWAAAVVLGGVAFAALGVAIGALAREVSAASLMALLISLPVAFVALVPGDAVSGPVHDVLAVIAFCFPFRATLDAVTNAFSGASPGPALALAHLAALAAVYGAVARTIAQLRTAR